MFYVPYSITRCNAYSKNGAAIVMFSGSIIVLLIPTVGEHEGGVGGTGAWVGPGGDPGGGVFGAAA